MNVKAFKLIRSKNTPIIMTTQISYNCKQKFNKVTCNSNQKWNNITCQYECKNYRNDKKDYIWNPDSFISENSKY